MSEENLRNEDVENEDVLGAHDEEQLKELGEADAYGGTSVPCGAATVAISIALCPTTKCTKAC